VGLAAMLETPCVIVDVQRLGPSTGLPEIPAEADIMQARWGSHGDYEIIALSPNSAQEVFDLTIKAFNFAEQYRIPVMMMIDKDVAYRREKVVIPDASEIKIHPRKYYKGRKDKYLPYQWDEKDLIPPMVDIGEGYRFHVTGLTHDQRGYPVMNAECQELCVHRLVEKIRRAQDKIIEIEEIETKDAEVIVISYGNTSRIVASVIERARKEGIKAGSIRLITVWPFPEKRIKKIAEKVKAFVVLERNYGQIVFEVERASYGKAGVIFVSPDERGMNISEESIFRAIKEGVNYKKRRDE
jgi:2-oxoglutarate ferredoxin oxidoreductase subunit alpha